jgi:hypothetical protein
MGFAWKTIMENHFRGFVACLVNAKKNGMFCEKVAAWQICEKMKDVGSWGYSLDLFIVYAIHYVMSLSCAPNKWIFQA